MDDHEEVADEFKGIKLWWASAPGANQWTIPELCAERGEGDKRTGKSTMIAAIANYDLYDIELTAVKDNTELRKLLIETSSKSIIVIEDIDCSSDLTGQRKKKKEKEEEEEKDPVQQLAKEETDTKTSKVLVKNYLNLKSHHLFAKIHGLLEEINMTPAVPKTDPVDAESCFDSLIKALKIAKVEARLKIDEEAIKKESLGKEVKEKVEENTNWEHHYKLLYVLGNFVW
ncbi:AAA-ATPase 1 [Actinidia rufa]|uniref:AAA-ATPase 1 n=1 Tax=Actinidia rufa TaxID=165716 RepID=A0A7J0EKS3_9ERIC|nr:AAA-ATPase 1 [Actinidia rufa]